MTATGHPGTIIDAEVVSDAPPASAALVPLAATVHVLPKTSRTRPDPSFVTQLIATADQAPQTRAMRRGSSADAQAAYGPHISERRSVTRRTRQII
jgi:hypothetical protein